MPLKRKLTAAEHSALPADFQKEYKQAGDTFVLDIEGDDGVDWKQKREIEAEHRKNAEAKARQLQDEIDEIRRGNIPKADVEALEKSHKDRFTDLEKRAKEEKDALQAALNSTVLDSVVSGIANELFVVPDVMAPSIRQRLKVELTDGKPLIRVLDKEGKLSAMSAEDLKTEFKADAKLAAVLKGSSAGGSGAPGSGGGKGGSATVADFNKMNDSQRTALYKENPAEFKRLSDAANQPPA